MPAARGIGVDEATAVVVDDGVATVVGSSAADSGQAGGQVY